MVTETQFVQIKYFSLHMVTQDDCIPVQLQLSGSRRLLLQTHLEYHVANLGSVTMFLLHVQVLHCWTKRCFSYFQHPLETDGTINRSAIIVQWSQSNSRSKDWRRHWRLTVHYTCLEAGSNIKDGKRIGVVHKQSFCCHMVTQCSNSLASRWWNGMRHRHHRRIDLFQVCICFSPIHKLKHHFLHWGYWQRGDEKLG